MTKPIFRIPFLLLFASLVASQPAFSQSEDSAEYSVTFTGTWNLSSTPNGIPGGAHFTTIAGGKHNSSVSFWASGEKATSGLENLAELGITSGFLSEIRASTHTDESFTASPGSGITGTSTFTLSVMRTHPLITLASMIAPTPDWFVGLSGYSLLDSNSHWVSSVTVNLYPYDAGTEDGGGFSLSNPATSPQGVITSLRGVAPFSNEPMATIAFTRLNALPPPPPSPTISSIERSSNASQHTNADAVTWLVTFSEAVQNVSTDDFVVEGTTASATSVSLVSGSTTQYEVRVGGGNLAGLNGTISLEMSSSNNITNSSSVALDTTLPSTHESYVIDNVAPQVVSVSPARVTESPFTVTITFSEALQQDSFADLGDVTSDEATVSRPAGSGSSYQVTVTPTNPSQSGAISLRIPASAGTDLAGNASSAYQTSIDFAPIVNTPPVVNSVSTLTEDGLYHTGERIEIVVEFSESVTVSGTPSLALQFDSGTKTAFYDRGSSSRNLVFSYTLAAGDSTTDLGYVSSQALSLSSDESIVGSTGLAADLTLPTPGASGSLSQSSDIVTSGRQDAIPSFGSANIDDQVLMMNQRVDAMPLPSATGGDAPLQYRLEPMLPSGLQLDETMRQITGIPTEEFPRTTFTWSVTDADGDVARLTFTIMVLPRLPLQFPASASIDDQDLLQNDAVEIALPSARGGSGDLTYSLIPDLPAGLTIDLDTRRIAGTPTAVLSQTLYIWQVADEEGASASLTFSMTVLEDFQPAFDADLTAIDETYIEDSPIAPIELPIASSGNGQLTYELDPELPVGLTLNSESFQISGTPSAPQERTSFRWTVTDADGDSASITFYLTVLEDVMPSFAAEIAVIDRVFIADSAIDAVQLPQAMGGNGQIAYELASALPMGLVLDKATFTISGTPSVPQDRTSIQWIVTDEDGDSASFIFYLTVLEDRMPSFATDASVEEREFITDSEIDTFQLPRAMDGNGSLRYDLTPMLPEGLKLDEDTDEISGTPTEALQRTEFTWSVQDEDGDTSAVTFFLTVILDSQPVFGEEVADKVFFVDTPIDAFTLPSATGGNGALIYELMPVLPNGLSFDESSVSIDGTPTTVTPSTAYRWMVSDVDGDVAHLTFSITVLLPLQFPMSATIDDQDFLQNDVIETVVLPSAIGGFGDLTYSLSPDLPAGLTLDLDAGEIVGTPTAVLGRTQYTWQVKDEAGGSVSLTFAMTVLEDFQPAFEVADGSIDQTYIQDSPIMPLTLPSATSGNGQLTYELASVLPLGLVLDAEMFAISGTPSTPQARTSFRWTVTDEDGDAATFTFYLTVLEDLMPSFAADVALPDRDFITDSAIDAFQLPTAMGGNGLLRYVLTPQLPEGLAFDEDTYEISGTPVVPMQKTKFTWSVMDVDGDVSSLTFYLTIILDTQPIFGERVADKVLIAGTPIDAFTLPAATSGNGALSYELMPELPSGLRFDANAAQISGTPTTETTATTYRWTVTDIDGDHATLSFSILVQPAAPEVTGTVPNVTLMVGGRAQMVDVRSAIDGKVTSWQVDVADSSIATASVSATGVLTLMPQFEGQTGVTVSASNVTASVQINIAVRVVTDVAENEQIDAALALNASAILSGAMNVFKRRSDLRSESNGGGGTSARAFAPEQRLDEGAWHTSHNVGTAAFSDPLAFDFSVTSQYPTRSYGNDFVPLNFTHTTAKWSLWGAVDLQNVSSDATNNEIDGSLSSIYLGADFAITDTTFAGLAVATHSGSSSYEFSSADADGDGEIETSLTGIYPYLQAGDGDRFSMFLVGGFGSGDADIDRRHANGSEPSADADLRLFAGGFDYVVLRRSSLDLAIVGDAGVATISTTGDAGVLANREVSSSKSSIGSSVSFNRQVEGGSLVTSADLRLATGADDDVSRTGFELGANLNYFGDHVDFMLDGRTSTRSGDTDAQRSSLSARLRYKANADRSGLTLAVRPRWQRGSALGFTHPLDATHQMNGLALLGADHIRSLEGEIGYGFWTNNERALFTPSLTWQRAGSTESVLKLGTDWHFGRAFKSGATLGIDVNRRSSEAARDSVGIALQVNMRL